MDERIEYIFRSLEPSGVSLTDFSRLTSVSRETLYRWRDGGNASDKLRINVALTMASRLEKACRAGRLPLKERMNAAERMKVLRKIVAEMASK